MIEMKEAKDIPSIKCLSEIKEEAFQNGLAEGVYRMTQQIITEMTSNKITFVMVDDMTPDLTKMTSRWVDARAQEVLSGNDIVSKRKASE